MRAVGRSANHPREYYLTLSLFAGSGSCEKIGGGKILLFRKGRNWQAKIGGAHFLGRGMDEGERVQDWV